MKTEDGDSLYSRRRRQADNETWWQEGDADDAQFDDVEAITEPAGVDGDLSAIDFSQVFGGGGGGAGSDYGDGAGSDLIDPRALHLIDLMSQPDNCLVRSILQIWDSDLERIRELDERQILHDVNDALRNA